MANFFDQFDAQAAAEAPAQPQTPAQETASLSLGDRAVDLARAGVGGLRDLAQGVVQTPLVIGEALSPITDAVTGGDPEVTKAAFKAVKDKLSFSEVEQNKTVAGSIAREAVKWVTGIYAMGGSGAILEGGLAGAAKGVAAAGVTGFVLTDPHAQNLGNLLDKVPQLHGPVTDFMAAHPDDSDATNKLKGALENIVVTPMAEGLMLGLKATKNAIALRLAGKPQEAAKVIEEAAPAVEEALAKSDGASLEIFPAQKVAEAGANAAADAPVTVFRHGKPGEGHAFFGESEGGVSMYSGAGPLHSVELPASQLEKFRASNILKEEAAKPGSVEPSILAEAKLGHNPEHEFVLPKDASKGATEHYSPEGIGTRQMAQDATTRVADKEALLDRFRITRSKGDDGVAEALQGNINYAKYNSPDSVKQLMSDVVATTKKDLPDLMGSYQAQKETRDLARLLGKDPTDLYTSLAAMRMSSADMAAHVVAGKALVSRVAGDLYTVATKLANGLGTDIDKVGFAHMTDILASAMDHVASIQTEAARATAAGRMRVGMEGITKENFAKLLEKVGGGDAVSALAARIAAAGDAAGVTAALRGTPPGKFMAIHNFIWMNGVLGGLKTTITNLSTTAFNSALMPGYRIIGGLADQMVTGQGRDEVLKGLYQYKTMIGTWRDSFAMARKAFAQGDSVLLREANPLGEQTFADQMRAHGGNLLNRDFTGIENEAIGRGVEYLGKAIGLPSKFLVAQDEFFKQMTYRSHILADAHVDALKQGLDGQALKDFVNNRLTASIGAAGQGLDDAAILAAKAATFTQDLAAETLRGNRTLAEGIAGFSNAHPVVKGTILPFVKVPTNLFRQAWDMTPGLDLLRTQFRRDIQAGGEARAMALGKMGVGTALWGTAIGAALEGRITGSGPRDKDLLRQLGPDWKPYSFVFNNDDGTKSYVSFARFDPFGNFFGLAADMTEIAGKVREQDYDEAAAKATLGVIQNISSKTYLRGLTDALDALNGDGNKAKAYFQSRAASYVPGIAQLLNNDDGIKDVRGWFDGMRSRVPGWSTTVESKRDNFGDKVMPPMGWPYTAFNPFTYYRSTDDPVRKELAGLARDDIQAKFPLPSPTFGSKDKTVDLREIKNTSGQSAYDRWMELHSKLEIGGQTLHESMADLIASQSYKDARAALGTGDPTYRNSLAVDLVQKQFDLYEKVTWQKVIEEYPGLGEAMQQFKIGQKTTRVEGSRTATPIDQLRGLAGQQ
jgi:hypothetical protein